MTLTQQMILDNADAIAHGVRRITGPARLAVDITEDLIADATTALLGKRGTAYNPERASAVAYCRMVGYQVARDALRSMRRGGQFSGAYAGFGNAQLDADRGEDAAPLRNAPDADAHTPKAGAVADHKDSTGRAVRVKGASFGVAAATFANELAANDELAAMRAAVAAVLPMLSTDELALWNELAAGTFDAAEYAQRNGIATATAHVRANRLRSKVRRLLQQAA